MQAVSRLREHIKGQLNKMCVVQSMGDAPTFEVPEIGFPMYRGVIEVMDRGATEELKFRGCKKNELPVSSATAPLAAGK